MRRVTDQNEGHRTLAGNNVAVLKFQGNRMKTFLDCVPCFARQALDASRFATDDEAVHERVLREVLHEASKMDMHEAPPIVGQQIHRLIRQLTGSSDPYRKVKDQFNRFALKLYPELKSRIERSTDPMATAARLAVAGNIIDFGVNSRLAESHVHETIEDVLESPFQADTEGFAAAVDRAREVLYLADNAGEIVFDRLLIEEMPLGKVTVAVKGFPVINDATMVDARETGLTEVVEVIDNGSDAPGTILGDCSDAFRRRFDSADLVIAKGQGNYETLSDVEKNVYFLLKAKCPVIAAHLGCAVGSLIVRAATSSVAVTE